VWFGLHYFGLFYSTVYAAITIFNRSNKKATENMHIYLVLLLAHLVSATNLIIFNVIGDTNEDVLHASQQVVNFLKAMQQHGMECGTHVNCRANIAKDYYDHLSRDKVDEEVNALLHNTIVHYGSEKCVDRSIANDVVEIEHVTEILWAMQQALSAERASKSGSSVLSLSFSAHSFPVFTSKFSHLLDMMSSGKTSNKVMLLGKTKELGSITDWHDLMVVMIHSGSDSAHKWLETLSSIYLQHARRPAFAMLKPRPALLEAYTRLRSELDIGFFSSTDACVVLWGEKHRELGESLGGSHSINSELGAHPAFCTAGESASLHIDCVGKDGSHKHACSTLHIPLLWKITASSPAYPDKSGLNNLKR
jgi:hypothetical protein